MEFTLPPLPYASSALEPVISQRTIYHHYEKHHAGYVKKLDAALEGKDRGKQLEQIILESFESDAGTFNLAAQVWNHTFYWHSMSPDPETLEDAELASLIDRGFGSLDGLKQNFLEVALDEFGSGWTWLLYDPAKDALSIISTTDAVNPLPMKLTPILTLDVWEHAYYLDYQHERARYVEGFLDKLVDWNFAAGNLHTGRRAA